MKIEPKIGIVPRVSNEIFARSARQGADSTVTVEASMMEIYNEEVRDLLNPSRPLGGLKVHEYAAMGVVVEGLHSQKVANYAEIEKLFDQGNKLKGFFLLYFSFFLHFDGFLLFK